MSDRKYFEYGTSVTFKNGRVAVRGYVTGIAFDCPVLGLYYIVERSDSSWKKEKYKYPARIISSDKIVFTP